MYFICCDDPCSLKKKEKNEESNHDYIGDGVGFGG